MGSNLPASGEGRRTDLVAFRSRKDAGKEIAERIRNSLPHGRRGVFDSFLKNVGGYAVFGVLIQAQSECVFGSPGRTATEDVIAHGVNLRVGQQGIFAALTPWAISGHDSFVRHMERPR